MFVRGGLNFETGYFENQICELSPKGGGWVTPLDLISDRNLCRVSLKFARLCIEAGKGAQVSFALPNPNLMVVKSRSFLVPGTPHSPPPHPPGFAATFDGLGPPGGLVLY